MYSINDGVTAMMILFMGAFSWSSGPVAWVYAAETVVDTGLGVCMFTLSGTLCILSLVCPILMDPKAIGPSGVFFIFSGFSVFATIYVFFFLKETKNLCDKSKKLLYTPYKFLNDEDKAVMRLAKIKFFEEKGTEKKIK